MNTALFITCSGRGAADRTRDRNFHERKNERRRARVLLELGLADEAEDRGRERVAHERDGAAEKGREVLRRRLGQDLADGLLGPRRLEVRALLLLDEADRVDKRRGACAARLCDFFERRHTRSLR